MASIHVLLTTHTHSLSLSISSTHFWNSASSYTRYSASLSPHVPPNHCLRTQSFDFLSSHPAFFPFYGTKTNHTQNRNRSCANPHFSSCLVRTPITHIK